VERFLGQVLWEGQDTGGVAFIVVLGSTHSSSRVTAELDLYAPLVSSGCDIFVCDGIMAQVAGAPRTRPTGHGTIR